MVAGGRLSDAGSGLVRALKKGREGKLAAARLTAVARAVDRSGPAAATQAIGGGPLDVATRERGGSTILGDAVRRALAWDARPGRAAILRALLDAGTPVVDGAEGEGVPLVANVADSSHPRTVEKARVLVRHGADLKARSTDGGRVSRRRPSRARPRRRREPVRYWARRPRPP